MSFDPTYPPFNAEIQSAPLRANFNGLKALIDAMPVIHAVVIDGVNTLPPGDPATVSVSLNGTTLHFTFSLPQGLTGSQGPPGNDGSQGPPGNDGAPGPPFAQAVVDAVNTLPPGSPASVGVNFDGTYVRFTFEIPQGYEGPTGPQGLPGEVTQTDLDNGLLNNLGQCSNNSNGVSILGLVASDPPTFSEVQQIADKLDELINALRR